MTLNFLHANQFKQQVEFDFDHFVSYQQLGKFPSIVIFMV